MRFLFVVLLALLATATPARTAPAVSSSLLPSLVGERLDFRIRWNFITAGNASLEVLQGPGGRLLFRAEARTIPLLDKIYPVEDRVESEVELPGPRVV